MSAADVVGAINALYTSDDASTRKQADSWLETWQASPEAWTVANTILHDPNSRPEFTYFCAQTLKTKVRLLLSYDGPKLVANRPTAGTTPCHSADHLAACTPDRAPAALVLTASATSAMVATYVLRYLSL
jgi:hypothetical protein